MNKNLAYLWYIVRHKFFVFQAGARLKVPLHRLVLHDWTKFLPIEWGAYRDFYYGGWRQSAYTGESLAPEPLKAAYNVAWCHHMHKNDHHWQFWVMNFDDGGQTALPMPDVVRREMLADWRGAGRATKSRYSTAQWYAIHGKDMILHPDTRKWIERELEFRP